MTGDRKQLDPLIELLNASGARFNIHIHDEAILNARDGARQGLGRVDDMAPTFILKTDGGFLAAIIRGDTRLSYKKIKKELRLKDVSLAAPEAVLQVTGAEIGSVGLVNPGMLTLVDARLLERERVYGGCGAAGTTLDINTNDLVVVTSARVFDFTEEKDQGE